MKKIFSIAAVTAFFTSLSFGQPLGLHEVGGGIGYVSVSFAGPSTETIGGFLIGVHANLGELTKDLTLVPDIQYFSTSKDIGGGTWKVSDFAINANVHYNFEMEGTIKPYVGAGLGFNALSTTASATYPAYNPITGQIVNQTISATGSASRIGINLLAGANYKMNDHMKLFLEPRYVLASDFNHFEIKVGATWALK
jgi:Opacity protein and related surface antigens